MARINLEAKNDYENAVLKYLEENASDVLVEKINSGKKTLRSCFDYIRGEAKKQAQGEYAMISDAVVFGGALHYFEEDESKVKDTGETKSIPEPKELIRKNEKKQAKTVEKNEEQLSLFALLG